MVRFILRRLSIIPFVLLLANFGGFAYAYYVGPLQAIRNPYSFGLIKMPPFLPMYIGYLQRVLQLDFGAAPNNEPVASLIARTSTASAGLLVFSLALSILVGLTMGFRAVRSNPPQISPWLTVLTTVGLASPSFYIGILFITLSIIFLIQGPARQPLLPFQGYGWDAHLVLPTLALMMRPTVQIAQVTSGMLVGELGKQYVTAARSFGHSMQSIRRRYAFRNIVAPVILTIAGSLRLLVAELIIIERLFSWPGPAALHNSGRYLSLG
jgi:ABC-type dipeptide/oligopeptide/nickel transport system permease component